MENNNFKTPSIEKPVITSIESKSETSNLSADELKSAIYNLGGKKEDKNERNVIVTGSKKSSAGTPIVEKPVIEEKKEEIKAEVKNEVVSETPKEQVKTETTGEPKVTETVTSSLEEQVAQMVKNQLANIVSEKEETEEKEVVQEEPDLTAEDITPEILADPAKTSEYIMRATKQMAKKMVAEQVKEEIARQITPLKDKMQPISDKIEADSINNRQKEALSKFPELGTDEKFKTDCKKFINENKELINAWHKKGLNPFLKVAQIVKSDNLDGYLKIEREKAVKETEERMKKASGAFAEGGGKTSIDKTVNIAKMTADEMKQLINSSKK